MKATLQVHALREGVNCNDQSSRYAHSTFKYLDDGYEIRFAYEATGKITRFTDFHDIKFRSRTVFSFHQPETLKKRVEEKDTVRNNLKHTPENMAKSICIEAAELLECYQWGLEPDVEHVKEELADVIVYCQNMLDALGLDVDEIVNDKMTKDEAKYLCED